MHAVRWEDRLLGMNAIVRLRQLAPESLTPANLVPAGLVSAALGLGALILLALPTPAAAQNQLVDLPGDQAMVRYIPGALARASNVQRWLGYIAEDFSTWSKRPTRLAALVMDREQWESMELRQPYGLPATLGSGRIALPAYGDDGTVTRWRELVAILCKP